jgi:hypothetical protein
MNEIELVKQLTDEPVQADEQTVAHAFARLEREMGTRQPTSRRVGALRWSVVAGVAASAVVAVSLVALSSGPGDGRDRAVKRDGGAPVLSVQAVLMSAATKVEGTPAAHGTYWSVVHQEGGEVISGGNLNEVVQQIGIWDAGPGKQAWIASRDLSSRVIGPAPANAPVAIPADTPKAGAGAGAVRKPTPWMKVRVRGGEAFRLAAWEGMKPVDARRLPADPESLRRYLLRELRRLDPGIDRAEWMLSHVQRIGSAPVSPKVLGAAYRMLATEPGLQVMGTVTDPLGRRGTAVVRRSPSGAFDQRLVIDPATGRVLAKVEAQVKPEHVTHYEAVISYGWTDTVPGYPLGKVG